MKYWELENLSKDKSKVICIWGTNDIGQTWGYELLHAAGVRVRCYCDNNLQNMEKINEIIKVTPTQLFGSTDNLVVFIATSNIFFQKQIKQQLMENAVNEIYVLDYLFLKVFVESVLYENDRKLENKYGFVVNDRKYLERIFYKKCNYKLDVENPKTFNEKIQWIKLFDRKQWYTNLVDKYEVKEYISKLIGRQYVIPTIGVWNSFEDINFAELPEKFVLKCTHDSGSVVFCTNKKYFDIEKAREKLEYCLQQNYYYLGREWPYKNVVPRIIAEPLLEDIEIDYKLMCFNGKYKCTFTCTERLEGHLKVTFFNRSWERLPFTRKYPSSEIDIPKPQNMELMIALAEKISENLLFARIDFYEIKGCVLFGEITFSPGNGMEKFEPQNFDYELGSWIKLPHDKIQSKE